MTLHYVINRWHGSVAILKYFKNGLCPFKAKGSKSCISHSIGYLWTFTPKVGQKGQFKHGFYVHRRMMLMLGHIYFSIKCFCLILAEGFWVHAFSYMSQVTALHSKTLYTLFWTASGVRGQMVGVTNKEKVGKAKSNVWTYSGRFLESYANFKIILIIIYIYIYIYIVSYSFLMH